METLIATISTLIVTYSAGIIPSVQPFWFLPLVGGLFSTLGLFIGNKILLDGGSLFSMISFLYLQRTTVPNFSDLVLVILLFILLFGVFIFNRRAILLNRIKDEYVGDKKDDHLREFQLDSIMSISSILFAAFLLAFLGAVVAIYSALDIDLHPDHAVLLVMGLAVSFFVIIFIILDLIPRMD